MVIQIDGTPSTNKGALLMMYAILKEIELSHPDAEVLINNDYTDMESICKMFNLKIRKLQSNRRRKIICKSHIIPIALRFCKPLYRALGLKVPRKGVDVVLNAGGFQFGDQWQHTKLGNEIWEKYLSSLKSMGTKIIFLPQAFGPFEKQQSKEVMSILNKYVDIVVARDDTSFVFLKEVGVSNPILLLYPDFTASIPGIASEQSEISRGKVCIIPNNKIIAHSIYTFDSYVHNIVNLIAHIESRGKEVVLLNHEGLTDQDLCEKIVKELGRKINILYSNNALETKGIISTSYLVISSRFHGVANALNSIVPVLASSWSHKYQKLMEDYGVKNGIVDLEDTATLYARIDYLLDRKNNENARKELKSAKEKIMLQNKEMWSYIWSIIN